jgi:hypothetical protein
MVERWLENGSRIFARTLRANCSARRIFATGASQSPRISFAVLAGMLWQGRIGPNCAIRYSLFAFIRRSVNQRAAISAL